MTHNGPTRTWLAMVAFGLAVTTGSLGPSTRVGAAESATPVARRGAADEAIARSTQRTTVAANEPDAWVSLGDAPRHVGALAGMAWVQGALHEFEQSVEWATKALAVDPAYQPAHGLLGDAALEMGDYELAFEHYQKMLDFRPDLSSYSRGAQVLWVTGNQRKAVFMMDKAVNAGGSYAENTAWARAQLALLLWSQGALLPAEQVLE